jgi:hypothetical protein
MSNSSNPDIQQCDMQSAQSACCFAHQRRSRKQSTRWRFGAHRRRRSDRHEERCASVAERVQRRTSAHSLRLGARRYDIGVDSVEGGCTRAHTFGQRGDCVGEGGINLFDHQVLRYWRWERYCGCLHRGNERRSTRRVRALHDIAGEVERRCRARSSRNAPSSIWAERNCDSEAFALRVVRDYIVLTYRSRL